MLTIIDIVLNLIGLWTGSRKAGSAFIPLVLFVAEVVVTAWSIVGLGWRTGLLVGGMTSLLVFLVSSLRLAIKHDAILTYAATQAGATREHMKALAQRLRQSGKVFQVLGPIVTAQLMSYLAQRGRNVSEIEQMAPAIATLWVVHQPDLETFVRDFDRLMRLWHKPASESMPVADVLTAASQHSAATFLEMLDAMIAVADPVQNGSADPRIP